MIVTVASWSRAPVSSVTMPARLAPIDCPNAGPQNRTDARRVVVSFIARALWWSSPAERKYGANMEPRSPRVFGESWGFSGFFVGGL